MNTPHSSKVILTQMSEKRTLAWPPSQKTANKRLLRNTAFLAVVSFCLCSCAWHAISQPHKAQAVMSHLTAGFEYDDTIGRLQLVSNMLPESAMVFLHADPLDTQFQIPVQGQIQASHVWSQQEPWIEYDYTGDVSACYSGEIITVIKNRTGNYTIRVLHENGYESVYSGLQAIHASEHDIVKTGQVIGTATEIVAFELRKDGVSILPQFSEI